MCWLWHWRHSTSPLIESLLYSDEFSGVSFADEHFEQPQFGFDVLVFVVLHSQWGAVLLLNVPAGTRRQSLRRCEKKTFVLRFLIMQFQIFDIDKLFFSYLPFCLKNWSSNSFKFLRILFFSSLVSWSCSTSSCLWGEEKCFFKCLTLKYTQTSSIYKKTPPKNQQLWLGFCFFCITQVTQVGGNLSPNKLSLSWTDCNCSATQWRKFVNNRWLINTLLLIWMGVRWV